MYLIVGNVDAHKVFDEYKRDVLKKDYSRLLSETNQKLLELIKNIDFIKQGLSFFPKASEVIDWEMQLEIADNILEIQSEQVFNYSSELINYSLFYNYLPESLKHMFFLKQGFYVNETGLQDALSSQMSENNSLIVYDALQDLNRSYILSMKDMLSFSDLHQFIVSRGYEISEWSGMNLVLQEEEDDY